jgi:hypothetical protein
MYIPDPSVAVGGGVMPTWNVASERRYEVVLK